MKKYIILIIFVLFFFSEHLSFAHEGDGDHHYNLTTFYQSTILEQLWITGVLVAFSIFGIKVGLGLGSQVYDLSVSARTKIYVITCALCAYLFLFFSLYYLITHFNLLKYLDQFMNIIKYGMVLHLAVAFGLLVWGMRLLLSHPTDKQSLSCRACLLLILPCPVCSMAIFLNLTLAYSLSSMTALSTTLVLFFVFVTIIVFTLALIFPFRRKIRTGRSFLGVSMGLISLYFLLTIIIAPIYPKIKDVFAMASSNNPANNTNYFYLTLLVCAVLFLIGSGFIKNRYFTKGVS